MRIPLAIVGIVLLSVFYHVGTTAEPLVTCTIRAQPAREHGNAPSVSVKLINRTDHEIALVGSLDGSEEKWRYPYCYFEIIGPDGRSTIRPVRRCGNMNALRKEEFVSVPPGGAFDPYQHNDHFGFFRSYYLSARSFPIVGEYRIRFCYSTDEMHPGYWFGDLGRNPPLGEVEQLLSRVPKVSIASDWISVRVTRQAE